MLENFDLFQAVTSIIMALALFILKDFKASIDKIQHSITELNVSITMLIQKDHHNKERIAVNNDYIKKNQDEINSIRNKYHDLVNTHISKIQVLDLKMQGVEDYIARNTKA